MSEHLTEVPARDPARNRIGHTARGVGLQLVDRRADHGRARYARNVKTIVVVSLNRPEAADRTQRTTIVVNSGDARLAVGRAGGDRCGLNLSVDTRHGVGRRRVTGRRTKAAGKAGLRGAPGVGRLAIVALGVGFAYTCIHRCCTTRRPRSGGRTFRSGTRCSAGRSRCARIALSRLAEEERPLRLTYANDVIRTKASQARTQRQFTQVGCELIGC